MLSDTEKRAQYDEDLRTSSVDRTPSTFGARSSGGGTRGDAMFNHHSFHRNSHIDLGFAERLFQSVFGEGGPFDDPFFSPFGRGFPPMRGFGGGLLGFGGGGF